MTRFLLFICLLSQVMAANAAFASTLCAHADIGQIAHAMHAASDDAQVKQVPEEFAQQHCECMCDVAGHCAAATASAIASLNTNLGEFPPVDISLVNPMATIANGHKTRLYRPPSSS